MYELVGYQHVDIPAKSRNDRDVVGYSCHFLMEEQNPDFTGRSGCKVFISDELYPDFEPQIGDRYLLVFNQKGKLQGFNKLDG